MVTELSSHPLVAHYLTILRNKETSDTVFREVTRQVTSLLMQESAKALSLKRTTVETPLESAEGAVISGKIIIVPILRAGLGMLDSAMAIIPGASVGYIGLERDEATAVAHCYYSKMPPVDHDSHIFVIDPMLATGGSAAQTIKWIKEFGAFRISMVCIIAAPEGIESLRETHPDVNVVTGVIDQSLDDKAYIRPGLGDFGDRLFGT